MRRRAAVPTTRSRSDDPDPACGPDPFGPGPPWEGWATEARDGVRYAAGLIRGLAVLGVAAVIAVAVMGVVPGDPLAVPVATAVGTPLYMSDEAFVPIARHCATRAWRMVPWSR